MLPTIETRTVTATGRVVSPFFIFFFFFFFLHDTYTRVLFIDDPGEAPRLLSRAKIRIRYRIHRQVESSIFSRSRRSAPRINLFLFTTRCRRRQKIGAVIQPGKKYRSKLSFERLPVTVTRIHLRRTWFRWQRGGNLVVEIDDRGRSVWKFDRFTGLNFGFGFTLGRGRRRGTYFNWQIGDTLVLVCLREMGLKFRQFSNF